MRIGSVFLVIGALTAGGQESWAAAPGGFYPNGSVSLRFIDGSNTDPDLRCYTGSLTAIAVAGSILNGDGKQRMYLTLPTAQGFATTANSEDYFNFAGTVALKLDGPSASTGKMNFLVPGTRKSGNVTSTIPASTFNVFDYSYVVASSEQRVNFKFTIQTPYGNCNYQLTSRFFPAF